MKILGIETSCDETAVCVVEAGGPQFEPGFKVLGNALFSQIAIHAQYGGVFPGLAKREHAKNLTPLLENALTDAGMFKKIDHTEISHTAELEKILSREIDLFSHLKPFLETTQKPDIDAIAVTAGPGLEPALWVGISFALAIGKEWNIPVYPTNHMAGHILSPLLEQNVLEFPVLALLISGGHTELVTMESWMKYKVIGQTRDDAVGEAFDKVARLLSLPYPGGPEISRLAGEAREKNITPSFSLPRPMIKTPDYDFSFSGIKTAVLYLVKKIKEDNKSDELTEQQKLEIALEFETAVTDVLLAKTKKYLEGNEVKTLILGGGVTANKNIREAFTEMATQFLSTKLLIPTKDLSTDNAVMIAIASYFDIQSGKQPATAISAKGNMSLSDE